jgi:hypothetical protein
MRGLPLMVTVSLCADVDKGASKNRHGLAGEYLVFLFFLLDLLSSSGSGDFTRCRGLRCLALSTISSQSTAPLYRVERRDHLMGISLFSAR